MFCVLEYLRPIVGFSSSIALHILLDGRYRSTHHEFVLEAQGEGTAQVITRVRADAGSGSPTLKYKYGK